MLKVIDLINKAAKGEQLPAYIKLKGDMSTWVKTGWYPQYGYFNGKVSLGALAAFDTDFLNCEVEEVTVTTGEQK